MRTQHRTHASWPASRHVVIGLLIGLLASAPARAAERRFELAIAARHIGKSPPTLRVQQGDNVTIVWHSDEIAHLHLHGYDLPITVKPDASAPQTLALTARMQGRFPLSAHGFGAKPSHQHEVTLLYLEVLPP